VEGARPWSRLLKRWALALVLLGILWRTVRYLLQFPIWGDEAFVCVNFLDQTYAGLTGPLRNSQIAPILFLWGELSAFNLLGGSELALRLLPWLAGVGGLVLFWRLARLTLPPLAATLAVGFLAVAYFPVRHSCEVKPYAFDLCMALVLLVPAASWLRRPERLGRLACLALLAPLALAASYPTVFVAGGVSLALLPTVCRRPGWAARAWYAAYLVLTGCTFLACFLCVGRQQQGPSAGIVDAYLKDYWADAFPPANPIRLAGWLLKVHTGDLMAYPVGAGNGASSLTFLLCLAGAWYLWRSGHSPLLVLCVAPFGLALLAAALQRYPYGGAARISQHLAPAICLLAGAGAAAWIGRCAPSAAGQYRWGRIVFALLIFSGLAGLVINLVKPYKTQGDFWARQLVEQVLRQAGPHDQVAVLNPDCEVKSTLEWYFRQHSDRIALHGAIDWRGVDTTTPKLWCLRLSWQPVVPGAPPAWLAPRLGAFFAPGRGNETLDAVQARLASSPRPWALARYAHSTLEPSPGDDVREHCEVYCWASVAPAPSAACLEAGSTRATLTPP
jgi:hypothetical protein